MERNTYHTKKKGIHLLNKYSTKKENYYLDISNDNIKVFKIKDSKIKEGLYKESNLTLIKSLKKPSVVIDLSNELKKMGNHYNNYDSNYKLNTKH